MDVDVEDWIQKKYSAYDGMSRNQLMQKAHEVDVSYVDLVTGMDIPEKDKTRLFELFMDGMQLLTRIAAMDVRSWILFGTSPDKVQDRYPGLNDNRFLVEKE